MAHPIEVDNEHHSTGCFDDIFAVFKNYSHPIILVEFCAFKWMGLGAMKRPDVDFLVRDSQIEEIVKSVIETGKYESISEGELGKDDKHIQVLRMRDDKHPQALGMRRVKPIFLSAEEKPYHITFWSESSYHLSVDGEKVEVPNTVPLQEFIIYLIEDRFNSNRMGKAKVGFVPHFLAQTPKDGALPIYIPPISRMVEALIRQLLCWPDANVRYWDFDTPAISLEYFIKRLYLYEPEQSAKLMPTLSEDTRDWMQQTINGWVPKHVSRIKWMQQKIDDGFLNQ
jgi:hypothetical protein